MDFYSSLDSRLLDSQKPTLFEITSCKQLESLISPSIRYILVHYAHHYPRYLLKIINNFDELNLVTKSVIEYIYLKTWNSTFIEKFYGIKRVNANPLIPPSQHSPKFESLRRLKKYQILISLLDSVIVPYVSTKLNNLYEKLLSQELFTRFDPHTNGLDYFKHLFIKIFPTLRLMLNLLSIIFQILYLSSGTSSITFFQFLFKISYARLTAYDHSLAESRESSLLSTPKISDDLPPTLTTILYKSLSSFSIPIKKMLLTTTNTVLPASLFLLKFLEWYNSTQSNKPSPATTSTPRRPYFISQNFMSKKCVKNHLVTKTNKCRICKKLIHNPGIIETGYVFCYKCIYEHLRDQKKNEGGRCPISGRRLLGCSWSESRNEWKVDGIRRLIL